MESTTKAKFKHAGLGIIAVVLVLIMIRHNQGEAPGPELLVLGAAGVLATIFGFTKDQGNPIQQIMQLNTPPLRVTPSESKPHSLVSIFELIVHNFGGDVTNQFKALLGMFKSFGKPVYFSGTISWGKGKTYPIVLGKNPEE